MKTRLLKTAAVVMVLFFIGTGVALARERGYHGNSRPHGNAYGHNPHKVPPSHYYAPRHSHRNAYNPYRQSCPVIVRKHYYSPPAYYYVPAPSGFYFGMSGYEPGLAFSFGVSNR
ncbi:MAG: hypothetical protein MUD16_17810 [Desulfobacterales bacterium]|jgi:hypothetical protein|nr:hypothetical protein [Desulfobacterales bacterium]